MSDEEANTFTSSFRKVPDTFGIEEALQRMISESRNIPAPEVLSVLNKFRKEAGLPPIQSSDKIDLGIFWLNESCSDVLHSKTALKEDIDKNDPTKYSFQHRIEWEHRPKDISGSYDDYPRGRIYYQNDNYLVGINIPIDPGIETMIRGYFNLPNNTEFKQGYW